MALTEEHGMENNFQKLIGEFRIGIRPNEKCMTALTELKSPNSVTEFNTNICAIHDIFRHFMSGGKATTPGRKRRVARQFKRQIFLVTTQRTWTRIYNVSHYV